MSTDLGTYEEEGIEGLGKSTSIVLQKKIQALQKCDNQISALLNQRLGLVEGIASLRKKSLEQLEEAAKAIETPPPSWEQWQKQAQNDPNSNGGL